MIRWLVTSLVASFATPKSKIFGWFEVAVNHTAGVGCPESVDDREQDLNGLDRGQLDLAIEDFAQRLALQKLHHHEGLIVTGTPEVEDTADGWVLEAGRCASLGQEAVFVGGRRHVSADQLEGYLGVEREVLGDPHCSHSALADQT